ncbi:MAG: hypothetical protein HY698_17590 [Deltaproteobacteria bacterium]|nr:hypothetical protein [Deltaproteobacteria bacterium]
MRLISPLLTALVAWGVLACGHPQKPGSVSFSDVLTGLPPRKDPPLDLADPEDLARAHALFATLDLGDPTRATRRRELLVAHERIILELGDKRPKEAFAVFEQALALWDPRELWKTPVSPELALLGRTADLIYRQFSQTGAGLETITALAALIAVNPDQAEAHKKRYEEIASYLDDLAVAEKGEGAQHSRPIAVFEKVILHFPSPWVTETLVAHYLARHDALRKALEQGEARLRLLGVHEGGILRPTWNLVRAHVLADRLPAALPIVSGLAGQVGDEEELRRRLTEALGTSATAKSWLALAAVFLPQDDGDFGAARASLVAARKVCEVGARHVPSSIELAACVGEASYKLRDLPMAIQWIENARRLAPGDHEIAGYLMKLYHLRLIDLVSAERIDAARKEVARISAFHDEARKRWPGKRLEPPLSDAQVTLGRGLVNAGYVEAAAGLFQKASATGPHADALEQLAVISQKRRDFARALSFLDAAIAIPREESLEWQYDRARLGRLAGEALSSMGKKDGATARWEKALAEWEPLLLTSLSPSARAHAAGEKARLLFHLGRTGDARHAFEQSVDADPEQAGVYADAIAFLLLRGEFPSALDAYHRALGRSEVDEYFKAYTTLWIVGFARAREMEPDKLAMDYLAERTGNRWYEHLARHALGKTTLEELLKVADTRGRRAEAYFYEAMQCFARKQKREATEFLRRVIATDMLGFFEYDMAQYFLQNGPPTR